MDPIDSSDHAADKPGQATEAQDSVGPEPAPTTALNLYRRLEFGRKHLFGHENPDQAAEYFILNPVPHKHSDTWRPVFYRGDNPKYADAEHSSRPVARALRTSMWSSFQIQLGDGVSEVLENKARAKKRRSHERAQRMRRFFCLPEKPPKEPLEDPREIEGLVTVIEMRRSGFPARTLRWTLGGREYQWKGTRRFGGGPLRSLKGLSHDFKLVDADNKVIATFEKDRWGSYKRSEKIGHPPNKKREFIGTLLRYPAADEPSAAAVLERIRSSVSPGDPPAKFSKKLTRDLHLEGSHSGDVKEEAIAFTCWIAVEAEHRLRYKILDFIEEIAEYFGGG